MMRRIDSIPLSRSGVIADFICKHYKLLLFPAVAVAVVWPALTSPRALGAVASLSSRVSSLRATAGSPPKGEFHLNLLPVGNILLHESPSVLNVSPRVQPDPVGGFLVADADEAQIRRYGDDGRLISVFGRKGRGPGEFLRLTAALRTNQHAIAAIEIDGRLSLFDPSGSRALRTWRTGLGPVYAAASLGDTALVLAGRIGGQTVTDLLHIWDVREGRVVRSFFPAPTAPKHLEGAYAFAGTSAVAVRGDTLAAVFALSDFIFLYSSGGQLLETVKIPFKHFKRAVEPMPTGATLAGYRDWASRFSAISQVYWTDNGDFLVQYYDTNGINPSWRLLRMDRHGRWIFEIVDSPELLAVSPQADRLFFVEPESLTPNHWLVAEFRR